MGFVGFFQKKEENPFGSECKGYFALAVILLIYNSSKCSSLKVRVSSSSAFRAPEDKHQDICSSQCLLLPAQPFYMHWLFVLLKPSCCSPVYVYIFHVLKELQMGSAVLVACNCSHSHELRLS